MSISTRHMKELETNIHKVKSQKVQKSSVRGNSQGGTKKPARKLTFWQWVSVGPGHE